MGKKVIAYFDGFNYYEGLRKKGWKKYYWQDFVKFVEFFLRPYQEMNLPAASRRGISEEFVFNLAASSGELTPNEIRGS